MAVEHRIEYVTEKNGVVYYNDSKGTNPDAAIKGIQAMDRPTLLIGGGYDKQSSYDEWIEAFDGKVRFLVLIGQTREKIEETAHKCGFMNTILADNLEEAVKICAEKANKGDAVLLSPACASWGTVRQLRTAWSDVQRICIRPAGGRCVTRAGGYGAFSGRRRNRTGSIEKTGRFHKKRNQPCKIPS